jgi:uncharacterized RDD family membrane protein YckC
MAFRHPALDLTVAVTTPENISFEYQIAGPFRRLPAMILDIAIRWMIVIVVLLVAVFTGIMTFIPSSGILLAVGMNLGIFALSWFYGLFFEIIWNGQTPGKRAMNLRVVSVDGRPINGAQATIRNFLRVADFFPYVSLQALAPDSGLMIPTLLVSLICMLMTRRFQRVGDLAAGTMVVVDERGWQVKKVAVTDERVASLAEFIPANFQMTRTMAKTVALYMERRPQMSASRQQQVAIILAGPLMKKFGFRSNTSADLFLSALYFREFYNDSDKARVPSIRNAGSPLIADQPMTNNSATSQVELGSETKLQEANP